MSVLARRYALDAFAFLTDDDDALHENAGRVNVLRVDVARRHQPFHFGNCDLARHRAQRIEIARRLIVNEVAVTVADARANESVIANDAFFQYVFTTVETASFLLRRGDCN